MQYIETKQSSYMARLSEIGPPSGAGALKSQNANAGMSEHTFMSLLLDYDAGGVLGDPIRKQWSW